VKSEIAAFSESVISIYQTTRFHILEYRNINHDGYENLKFSINLRWLVSEFKDAEEMTRMNFS
jgi:hypothetical protein